MASTYDRAKDPTRPGGNQKTAIQRERNVARYAKGKAISTSDTVDFALYAPIVVTTAGNLKLLPAQNDDADTVTFTGVAVGFVPPFVVRRVFATGTTATVASLSQ